MIGSDHPGGRSALRTLTVPPCELGERYALSRGVASDTHGSTGKPEPAFQSAESALPVQDRPKSGACAVLGPTRC